MHAAHVQLIRLARGSLPAALRGGVLATAACRRLIRLSNTVLVSLQAEAARNAAAAATSATSGGSSSHGGRGSDRVAGHGGGNTLSSVAAGAAVAADKAVLPLMERCDDLTLCTAMVARMAWL